MRPSRAEDTLGNTIMRIELAALIYEDELPGVGRRARLR
jgi:hypothetical protein